MAAIGLANRLTPASVNVKPHERHEASKVQY